MTIESLLRPHIRTLIPYSTARDEYQGEARVYLDANENPFGGALSRYPDPHAKKLRESIAELRGVATDQIFVGNGSDEAIDLIIRAFVAPGEEILTLPPTYGMYAVAARNNAALVRSCPLMQDFTIDFDSLAKKITPTCRVLFLCSPNNPTGNQLTLDEIRTVVRLFSGIIVVDEAYIDFASGESAVGLLPECERLVVLQTLSKAWGLAAARVGIAFGTPRLIAALNTIKLPYNLSLLAQQAAAERLLKPYRLRDEVNLVRQERAKLTEELSCIKGIERVYPSEANFLLIKCRDAATLFEALRAHGVIVRDRSREPGCERCLRITVGTPSQNREVISLIRRCA